MNERVGVWKKTRMDMRMEEKVAGSRGREAGARVTVYACGLSILVKGDCGCRICAEAAVVTAPGRGGGGGVIYHHEAMRAQMPGRHGGGKYDPSWRRVRSSPAAPSTVDGACSREDGSRRGPQRRTPNVTSARAGDYRQFFRYSARDKTWGKRRRRLGSHRAQIKWTASGYEISAGRATRPTSSPPINGVVGVTGGRAIWKSLGIEAAYGYHMRVDTFAGEAFVKVMAGIAYFKSHWGSPLSGFIKYETSDGCELHRWAWSWRTDQLRVIHELTFSNRGVAALG